MRVPTGPWSGPSLALFALLVPTPANAGPWTMAKGDGRVIVSAIVFDSVVGGYAR